MGVEIFYKLGNKWFYETVRPSYKGVVDSYSAISKVKYPGSDHIVSKYRIATNPAYSAFKPAAPNFAYNTFKPRYQFSGRILYY